MRLLLDFPNIPSCAVCQKYMVDYDHANGIGSGTAKTFGPPGNEQPQLRPSVCPPPCKSCPKQGPEHEQEYVLSAHNWRTLEFYREVKATFGKALSEQAANDPVVQRNFALLNRMFGEHEQDRLADVVGRAVRNEIASLFSRR